MSERPPDGRGVDPPEWFFAARDSMRDHLRDLGEVTGRGLPPVELRPSADGAAPAAGEIRALFADEAPDDPAAPMRLVLVRYRDDADGYASVALLSDHTRMAGGTDVVLPQERTGLPYVVMVETDVAGPVWFHQLSEPLGAVDEQTVIGIIETEYTGVPAVARAARGLPLAGPGDQRWGFKLAEAAELAALTAACAAELLRRGDAAQAADEQTALSSPDEADGDLESGR